MPTTWQNGLIRAPGGELLMSGGVSASDGAVLPLDTLSQALGYDGSGNLTTITVSYGGNTYVQTLTYSGMQLTGVSAWVLQ